MFAASNRNRSPMEHSSTAGEQNHQAKPCETGLATTWSAPGLGGEAQPYPAPCADPAVPSVTGFGVRTLPQPCQSPRGTLERGAAGASSGHGNKWDLIRFQVLSSGFKSRCLDAATSHKSRQQPEPSPRASRPPGHCSHRPERRKASRGHRGAAGSTCWVLALHVLCLCQPWAGETAMQGGVCTPGCHGRTYGEGTMRQQPRHGVAPASSQQGGCQVGFCPTFGSAETRCLALGSTEPYSMGTEKGPAGRPTAARPSSTTEFNQEGSAKPRVPAAGLPRATTTQKSKGGGPACAPTQTPAPRRRPGERGPARTEREAHLPGRPGPRR